MTSQISGPCCDSDIKPDQYKSLVWESHVQQQIFVVFEDVYRFIVWSTDQLQYWNLHCIAYK